MFLFLYGPNTFFSRRQLEKSIADFKNKRDQSGFNVIVLDAEKTESSQILEALTASPFLAEKRLVVVERIIKKNDKNLFDILAEMVEKKKFPDSTIALFWEGEIPEKKQHQFIEFLKKQTYSKFFGQLSPREVSLWIGKKVAEDGLKIENTALNNLASHPLACDLWRLDNEINKIIHYASQKEDAVITVKDVNLFLPAIVDDNAFHFIDALVVKDSRRAIKLLHDQWQEGAAEAAVFGALVWEFKNLLIVKDHSALNPGLISEAIAKELALSPFVVKKTLVASRNFDFVKLKEIYQNLLEIDVQAKTGRGDYKTLLDMLVAKICA